MPQARTTPSAALCSAQAFRPQREAPRQLARGFVVHRHLQRHARPLDGLLGRAGGVRLAQRGLGGFLRGDARRAHEDDGVVDTVALEARFRLDVLGEDAQDARILAVEEGLVVIGVLRPLGRCRHGSPMLREECEIT
ncbi:MAG TPA: hypothetical protein VEA40_01855 [Ramlibacter sp.]|nr:hypothetical protein [Ramlibacter sp.]